MAGEGCRRGVGECRDGSSSARGGGGGGGAGGQNFSIIAKFKP